MNNKINYGTGMSKSKNLINSMNSTGYGQRKISDSEVQTKINFSTFSNKKDSLYHLKTSIQDSSEVKEIKSRVRFQSERFRQGQGAKTAVNSPRPKDSFNQSFAD